MNYDDKRYCATCDDEEVYNFSFGSTHEEALNNFKNSAEFQEFCNCELDPEHDDLAVISVFRVVHLSEVDEDNEHAMNMRENGWTFVFNGQLKKFNVEPIYSEF